MNLDNELELLAGGLNWADVAAGIIVGGVTAAVDVLAPEVSPVVTQIGYNVSRALIIKGLATPDIVY
ncbi:hypothetical protein Alches_18520 [Alicyclobacillus hesperidum subsp. aegles]|uniref:hypothetical protein n=1 Tax=Alicyclobacillus hesperidum TaxID=89784 RepID=UPI0002F08887|nr:hypothetical protein [Alicyclobacillus hesperidum]KRW90655.1 hypothetical protein SD51_13495 [Alicyclobacillus tengchongensis]GLG01812.1 hypothetical protein Alches_18520 [Alicyclobacillus hesperidum subsp. aegles]